MIPLAALLASMYGVITYIFWRNIKLAQPWKAMFCLTLLPLFIVAMAVNVRLMNEHAPWLLSALSWSKGLGLNRLEAGIGLLASTPIALAIGYLWYRLFVLLAKATAPKTDHKR